MTPREALGLCSHSPIKRNPLVMLYLHPPINDSSGYLNNTDYLAVM